jgi:hypothetical protein
VAQPLGDRRYDPEGFVHAKLVGVTAGPDGWLLSGSANLSRAALTEASSLSGGHGNVELSVLTRLPADMVRAAFLPPDTIATEVGVSRLAPLQVHHHPDIARRAVCGHICAAGRSATVRPGASTSTKSSPITALLPPPRDRRRRS